MMTMISIDQILRFFMLRRSSPAKVGGDRIVYVPMTKAGTRITHDNALTVSGFWAGVRAISDPISYLSWHAFERVKNGKERRDNLTIDWILNNQANEEMSAGTFRETILAHAISWGNGYAEIERDNSGRPMWLWPLAPDRTYPDRDTDGTLFYWFHPTDGRPPVPIPARDIFHLKGLGFDGITGYSVVKLAAQSLGLAKAMEENAASYFGNGSRPSAALTYPGVITPEARENTRKEWIKLHGGPGRAYNIAVLDQGLKYEPFSMSNLDSQMIESRKLSVTEMARWLRISPHKLYDLERATFSNVEQMAIEFVTDTLMPWVNRLEQEANIKLFGIGSQGRLFTRINVKTLLRGDTASQSDFLTKMLDRGVYDIDEAREFLDMNPLDGPDGKKRFVPQNMQLLEKAGEEPEPLPEPPDDEDSTEDDTETEPVPNNRLNGNGAAK
jgi:HK97 family phage portal protein